MIIRIVIVLMAVNVGGFMLFDGVHAMVTGDYVTPKTGDHAGQYGPWTLAVEAVGIDPRSTLMKWIFAGYGAAYLLIIAAYLLRRTHRTWLAMILAAAGSIWYLPFGTLLAVIQILLLTLIRSARGPTQCQDQP